MSKSPKIYKFAARELELRLERMRQDPKVGDDLRSEYKYKSDLLRVIKAIEDIGVTDDALIFTASILSRLLHQSPLSPLTGEESEWADVGDGITEQNKRCPRVFRYNKDNSTALMINARLFVDPGEVNGYYLNTRAIGEEWDSRVKISFPYTVPLKPEVVMLTPEDLIRREEANLELERKIDLGEL